MPTLQYIRTSYEEIQTLIRDEITSKVTFIAQIQLQSPIAGQQMVTIVDHIRGGAPWLWKPKYTYDVSPLISNFQKCIRRKLVEPALATAKQLLAQDPIIFLRRLTIILLEDTLLQPFIYSQVAWLMAAVGKRYILTVDDVQVIMDSIVTALEAESRYDLTATSEEPIMDEKYWLCYEETDAVLRSAFVGIRLRALAGGMKGDAAFMERLALRVRAQQLPLQTEISTVDPEDIPEFTVAEHMQTAAIDFHCCPQLLEMVRSETALKSTDIQEAIWWHRSSLNERNAPHEAYERAERFKTSLTWGQIARTVSGYAESRLRLLDEKKARTIPVKTLDAWFKAPTPSRT
jgi:hypothetical protein